MQLLCISKILRIFVDILAKELIDGPLTKLHDSTNLLVGEA